MTNQTDSSLLLSLVYRQWARSQALIPSCLKANPEISVQQVTVAIENAVMKGLTDGSDIDIDELLEIDVPRMRVGLREAGLDMSLAEAWVEALQLATTTTPVPEGLPTRHADQLAFGDFVHPITDPVRRLLNHLDAHMPAELATIHTTQCCMRYETIFARTRHIGPPQRVYDQFYDWGVRNEGFASPFNARLLGKENAHFFSAFPSTDAVFGSRGSFFDASVEDHPGAWCIDPPFLKETLDRACDVIRSWGSHAPSVLFICPASYAMPIPVDETVVLRAGTHEYEGMRGECHPLPVDVAIHRIGELAGFNADDVSNGYLPQA